MDKLIFTAVSGAERLMRAQQVHANNLANLDTAGFRASMEAATDQKLGGYGYDDRHLSTMQADNISTRAGTVRQTARSTWRSAARVTWPCSTATARPTRARARSRSAPTARCRCTATR